MSEDKKSLIDLVPDSVDNAVKNITDKPTQNMEPRLLIFGILFLEVFPKLLKSVN